MPMMMAVLRYVSLTFSICGVLMAQSAIERQLASAGRQRQSLVGIAGSLRLQQTSVRRQVQLAAAKPEAFFVAIDPDPVMATSGDCAAMDVFTSRNLVESTARKAGIDANLLQAVAEQESNWKPCAVSPKGAQGLMQLMPATAVELGVADPFNAEENLAGGAALLKQLMKRYSGDLNRVLGAYNAGPARVDRAVDGIPAIPETMNYIEKILGKLP